MPDVYEVLKRISAERALDPLAPVTVVTASHASSLQLRRILAEHGAFAAVRFETLPRIAELLGAGRLAAAGKAPLARPIGDHLAEVAARQSVAGLAGVCDLPGYAVVLRQIFRRLRRGGIRSSQDVTNVPSTGHLGEVLRLYDLFRASMDAFYDEEDLLDAAADAVESGQAGALPDLGALYAAPPGPLTAAGNRLVNALGRSSNGVQVLADTAAAPVQQFVVASDPASDVAEAVRLVVAALEDGVSLHEVAVFHGADRTYGRMLREALNAAGVEVAPLPGIPLIETRTGRAALSLAMLPQNNFSRTAVMDFFSVAPLRPRLPGAGEEVRESVTAWERISREAGITRNVDQWVRRLDALARDRSADAGRLDAVDDEGRIAAIEREAEDAGHLRGVIEELARRLEPLREQQPAATFIGGFKEVVSAYIKAGDDDALEKVENEIDQLGAVGSVGGSFSLESFARALRANLEAATMRPVSLGSGVAVADYRMAAGLRFKRVVLCGAYEGAVPAGPGPDALIDDETWSLLKAAHPWIEDAATRIARAAEAVQRVIAAAGNGALTWSCPAYEQGGTREYYPSPLMAVAYTQVAGEAATASALRSGAGLAGPLLRVSSPMSASLLGHPVSAGEIGARHAVLAAQDPRLLDRHPARRAVEMLRARRSGRFTEWDGNLGTLHDQTWFDLQRAVSPTSLQDYATCGYRYFAKSLLRLRSVEEPDELLVMSALDRGNLVHAILERFFKEQQSAGRPAVREPWTAADEARLLVIADEEYAGARDRGAAGLELYADHEIRTIKAELSLFLAADTDFRQETGAVPAEFECAIPEDEVTAGVRIRGRVDRIDRTPDGQRAWVIDYKTGKDDYTYDPDDPFLAGTKLQLPAYLAAVKDAAHAEALYWFISQKASFRRAGYQRSAANEQRYRDVIRAIPLAVRSGSFPAVSGEDDEFAASFDNCRYCDFGRICSRRRDLEHEAKAGDMAVAPWQNVGAVARGEV